MFAAPYCVSARATSLVLQVYAINTLTEEQTAVVSLDHLMKGQESVRGISRDEDDRRTMFVYRCAVYLRGAFAPSVTLLLLLGILSFFRCAV